MRKSYKYVIAILMVALLAFGAYKIVLPKVTERPIPLSDYIAIEYEGASKYATATAIFADHSFRQDFEKQYGASACDAVAALCNHVTLSPATKLKNGDTITLQWDTEKAATIANQYGMTFDFGESSYVVTGLSKIEKFYPFYGLSVSFDGRNGSGKATLDGQPESEYASLRFTIAPSTNLYNGDVVRLAVQAPDGSDLDDYCMKHFGKVPKDSYKDFTVSRLTPNLTALNQLGDGEILSLAARAQGNYEESVVRRYADGQTYTGLGLSAATLLVNDSDTSRAVSNYLVLTFAIDVHNTHVYDTGERYDADNRFYWNIVYRDLDIHHDGTLSGDFDAPRLYSNSLTRIYATPPSSGTTVRWDNDGYDTLEDALEAASNVATHFYVADVWLY